ncbi:MAG: 2OG-Fe(II) oxygenase [Rhodopila sp.]
MINDKGEQTMGLPRGLLDLDALRRAPVTTDPFTFTVVRDFAPPKAAEAIRRDFPDIPCPGLLPVEATQYGPRFADLIQELQSDAVAAVFSKKFGLDLVGRPTMITVRGRCQERDGRIHTDSESKLVTALLYFNQTWEAAGGRLRLLRRPDDLQDMIAEVPPDSGTLIAFRRSDRSFHGHEPFVGVRRYVMINWMASGFAARRELLRHRISAVAKRAFAPAATAWDCPECPT